MSLQQWTLRFAAYSCAWLVLLALGSKQASAGLPYSTVNGRFTWEEDIKYGDAGWVVRVKEISTGKQYAMKMGPHDGGLKEPLHTEVEALRVAQAFDEFPKLIYPDPKLVPQPDKGIFIVGKGKEDSGQHRDYDFYVMTLCSVDFGSFLIRGFSEKKLYISVSQMSRWFLQALQAVGKLHAAGVKHGDLHTGNLCYDLLHPDKVMVIDFDKAEFFDPKAKFAISADNSPYGDYARVQRELIATILTFFKDNAHFLARFPGADRDARKAAMEAELGVLKTQAGSEFKNYADFKERYADKFIDLLTKDVPNGKKAWFLKEWMAGTGPLTSATEKDNVKPVWRKEQAALMKQS